VDVVGVPGLAPSRHLLSFIGRRKKNLSQTGSVYCDFPDAKAAASVLPKIEQDLPGIEGQGDLADKTLAAGQVGRRYHGPFFLRANVVYVDAVIGKEPVGAGAVVDVGVVVIRRIGLTLDEKDFIEPQLIGRDRRLCRVRRGRGSFGRRACGPDAPSRRNIADYRQTEQS